MGIFGSDRYFAAPHLKDSPDTSKVSADYCSNKADLSDTVYAIQEYAAGGLESVGLEGVFAASSVNLSAAAD
ncbi:hypothetical protein DYI42_13905 [Vannielia litorea]|nr:hypothetical protein [Vannielia litorea]